MPPRHVAILGGGISGLTTAFYLSKYLCKSSRITIIEKSHRTGGWIKSFPIPNSRIALEAGPRTFKATGLPFSVLQLVHDLNLTDRLVVAPITSAAGHVRYLYLEELGRLALLPSSPLDMLFSQDFRWVLSDLARDFFRRRNRDDTDDESIDSLVSRRFSSDAARVLVSSMVHGIYAADSRKLSAVAAFPILPAAEKEGNGSILRGLPKAFELREKRSNFLKPSMMLAGHYDDPEKTQRKLSGSAAFTFDGGLELVPRTLEARLEDARNVDLRKGVACTMLDRNEDGDFQLSLADGTSVTATHVVSTLPWPQLHSVIANAKASQTTPLPILQSGESSSVQVLNLVFSPSPEPLHPPAFGFLIPRPQSDYPVSATTVDEEGTPILQNVLGTVFDSCVDPKHDHKTQPTIMTLMMGGPYPLYGQTIGTVIGAPPQSSSTMLHSEELPIFLRTLGRLLGRKTPLPRPILNAFHTHLNAIPIPHPGARDELRDMKAAIKEGSWGPNFDVIGMTNGVGLGDIVTGARLTAANIKLAK